MKNVLITTQHRGVFFAQIDETQLEEYKKRHQTDTAAPKHLVDLKNCRMAIYFGTSRGVMELADTGPTSSSRIGATKTRIKNRVKNGVCPCCNRTFENLARHMQAKHSDFK